MIRKFQGDKLVLATHNAGKVREISALLSPYVPSFISAADLNLPEPVETETTFIGNAILKARAAAMASGLPALADDSGLAVEALNGDPGVYSARWAVEQGGFEGAMAQINKLLEGKENRRSADVCVLALAYPDGHVDTAEGRIEGEIVYPPRGTGGFGYDPCVQPIGYNKTFGEMTATEKAEISHRTRAFRALVDKCFR